MLFFSLAEAGGREGARADFACQLIRSAATARNFDTLAAFLGTGR